MSTVAVWSMSTVAKDPSFFYADSEDWFDSADVLADLSLLGAQVSLLVL